MFEGVVDARAEWNWLELYPLNGSILLEKWDLEQRGIVEVKLLRTTQRRRICDRCLQYKESGGMTYDVFENEHTYYTSRVRRDRSTYL